MIENPRRRLGAARDHLIQRVLRLGVALAFVVVFTGAASGSVAAAQQKFDYDVEHPFYGHIGTYTNIVDRSGEETTVESELHIVVRILGIVAYRQDANRSERWHLDRLVWFDGTTATNGERVRIHGEARGADGFAITSPTGTVMAPADVRPSNPWCPAVLNSTTVMSTRSGKLFHAIVSGGESEPVSFGGTAAILRQYMIVTDKRQFVWFDDRGQPVAFRTEEGGTPILFVLKQ
jgi:hypothetical protein